MSRRFWTEDKIITEIQKLYNQDEDLWYRAMERNHKDLIRASERYFKGWKNAVVAAGIDYNKIKKRSHQVWTEEKILKQLYELSINRDKLRSSEVQKHDKKLYHAAIRTFKSFNNALSELERQYGKIDPIVDETTITKKSKKSVEFKEKSNEKIKQEKPLELAKLTNLAKSSELIEPAKPIKLKKQPEFIKPQDSKTLTTQKTQTKPTIPTKRTIKNKSSCEMRIFTVRTRVRSERNVGETIEKRAASTSLNIGNIQYPAILNGYIFVECDDREALERLIKNIRNAQGLLNGETTSEEISKYVKSSRSRRVLAEGSKVEITDGQFKGERAVIQYINDRTKEVIVELLDEVFKMPITLSKNNVKLIK